MVLGKIITLKAADNQTFEVEEDVAVMSGVLKSMIGDGCTNNVIPLPIVNSCLLSKILEYCNRHKEGSGARPDELRHWDKEFIQQVDMKGLYDLMMAAHYLEIKSLLDLTCRTVADMIKEKPVEEIRRIFNINNEYTPEEEAKIRRENKWAFE